jgi:5,10-methylenetetrahydromethanopterin reductase
MDKRVGMVFGSITPPERIAAVARRAEELGFEEFWFSEDCFFSGAMSGAAQILAATRVAPVGTGAVSVMTRHPAVTAMEFAGLSRMYPGRVVPGIALGVRSWLGQMGLLPSAPLTALRDTVDTLRRLFAGETVSVHDGVHQLDRVALDYPPPHPLPIHVAAVNEKALRLSGQIADGTILSVLSTPDYVRWARGIIGKSAGGHRVTVFALYSVDSDGARARREVRDAAAMFLAAESSSALVRVPGLTAELNALLADGGDVPLAERIPERWLDEVAVAGTPEECVARLNRLFAAGADAVALWLFPTDRAVEVAELTARKVLPGLRLRDGA